MEENRESNQINVGSVIRSSVFPGCDVLITMDCKYTIVAWDRNYNHDGLLDNSDGSAVFIEGDRLKEIGYANPDLLKGILSAYPDLLKFCIPEASYASEERCSMDGYELVYESNKKILYAKNDSRGYYSYAEIAGWS